jgi:hypothetical protein
LDTVITFRRKSRLWDFFLPDHPGRTLVWSTPGFFRDHTIDSSCTPGGPPQGKNPKAEIIPSGLPVDSKKFLPAWSGRTLTLATPGFFREEPINSSDTSISLRVTPFRTITPQCHLRGFGHFGHFPEEVAGLGFFPPGPPRTNFGMIYSGFFPGLYH